MLCQANRILYSFLILIFKNRWSLIESNINESIQIKSIHLLFVNTPRI